MKFCTCEGFKHAVKIGAIKEKTHQVMNRTTGDLSRLRYYYIGPADIRKSVIFTFCPACGERVQVNHEFMTNPLLIPAPAPASAGPGG